MSHMKDYLCSEEVLAPHVHVFSVLASALGRNGRKHRHHVFRPTNYRGLFRKGMIMSPTSICHEKERSVFFHELVKIMVKT